MPETQEFAPARRGQNASLYTEEAVSSMTAVLSRFPDPDDMLVKAGLTRASLRPLEYDDEIAQCIDTRREALIAVPWRLEPQQGRASKRLTAILEPHIENLIRGAFEAVLYGYSVQEVVYRQESGGIGIDRVYVKPLEWFYIGTDGKLMHRQQTGGLDIECDPRKFILTRRQPSYRQPYGEALLTRLYWTAFFRGHGRKFWAKFLERFGEPLLVGKVKDQKKFVADVAALGLAAGLPVQPDDEIQHIAVTQAGEFERFENALSKSIQKIILGQTLTSDVGSTGSFAAAKVHDNVRHDKRNADIRLVSHSVQGLIDTLCQLNGWQSPSFVMADGTGLERERAERDKILVEAGIIKLTKDYVIDRYDFEEGDFEIPEAAPEVGAGETASEAVVADMSASLATFRRQKIKFTPQQQAIEDAADDLMQKVPEPIRIDAMMAAVKAATDPADLAVRLSLLLDQQDPRFTELLARAQFAAQTLGYVVAEQEAPQPKRQEPPALPQVFEAHIHMPNQPPQPIAVQFEAQPAPNITIDNHVHVPPAHVENVINVEPTPVTLEANIEAKAGETQVIVQPAAEIAITAMPVREITTKVERDKNGNIKTTTQTEKDA